MDGPYLFTGFTEVLNNFGISAYVVSLAQKYWMLSSLGAQPITLFNTIWILKVSIYDSIKQPKDSYRFFCTVEEFKFDFKKRFGPICLCKLEGKRKQFDMDFTCLAFLHPRISFWETRDLLPLTTMKKSCETQNINHRMYTAHSYLLEWPMLWHITINS